jgi:hypothetical protein
MAARIGSVLYGIGCILALAWIVLIESTLNTPVVSRWDGDVLLLVFVPAAVVYLIGRALRFILADTAPQVFISENQDGSRAAMQAPWDRAERLSKHDG